MQILLLACLTAWCAAGPGLQPKDKTCSLDRTDVDGDKTIVTKITNGFQCKRHSFYSDSYPGCVSVAERCNGVNDCGDNSDEKGCPGGSTSWQGLVAAGVASVFFGSNFLPVKTYETGDGMFFQWVLCASIWIVGVFVQFYVGTTPFEPIAAIGGASWATGNLATVPVIQTIGLAQGLLLWGTANMLMGWAAGRFGFFGIVPEVPTHELLQYMGVLCAFLSCFAFGMVRTTVTKVKKTDSESQRLLLSYDESINGGNSPDDSFFDRLSPVTKKIFGVTLGIASGVMYSFAFDPAQALMDTKRGATQNSLHYVYSQFTGIFLASTFWFMLYCAVQKNKPKVYPEIVLPACASGVMWAIAQTAWFIANEHLSQAVSYPIVATVPGIIGSLWGVLVFGEIKGSRNFFWLFVAFGLTFGGVVLNVMSNQ